ncbi:MAG: type II secretion system secretin GspD, partial [Gammaproteobacteria bacterium]
MWHKILHTTLVGRLLLCLLLGGVHPATAQESLTLNFNNTEISAVIAAVSEMTGRNFIVDPRVKGKVTIISKHGMAPDEVFQVFLSILKVHGFALIPGEQVSKIVPEVNAKQDAVDTTTRQQPGRGDEFVTRVVEISHVDAAQLVPILRPLVPQRGHLAAYPSSNVLIISDSAANINRLVEIIRRIDLSATDEIEVMPLQHASASELVRIVAQLDKADAKGAASKLKLVSDDRTNSILLSGDKTARLRIRALISHLDTPMEQGGDTQVVYLRHAVAKDLVAVLTGITQSTTKEAGQAAGAQQTRVNIQADENTNALVITAPPDMFRSLRGVIQKLDVRRAQVLVEAVIAEVSSTASRELGVQWGGRGSGNDSPIGVVAFNQGADIQGLLSTPPTVSDGLTLGLGRYVDGVFRVGALIRALAADAATNILSTPTLVTMDNEEAEIVVGQNVPFLTGQYSNTGGGTTPTNPFSTVERQDVGLTLKIKPQINEGDAVKLDVVQEVSSLAPSTVGVDLITNKRSIKTSVMVNDGEVLVLGGLITDDLLESEQRVPGLGDIPIVGWLFKYKKVNKVKNNLMVFIHPVILKDDGLGLAMTNEKYSYLRAKQLKLREDGLDLMNSREVPILQDMKDWLTLPPPYAEVQSNLPRTPQDAGGTGDFGARPQTEAASGELRPAA